jgi:hypothetical protein
MPDMLFGVLTYLAVATLALCFVRAWGALTDGLLQAPGSDAFTQPAGCGAWVTQAATMPRAVAGGPSSWPTIHGVWRPGLPPRPQCSPVPS